MSDLVTCSPSALRPTGSTSGRSRSGCWGRVTRPTTPSRRRGCGSVALTPTPSSPANNRGDQCVTPNLAGGGSSVAARIAASSTVFGRPDRGASLSPSSPEARKRLRHWVTVGRETPTAPGSPRTPHHRRPRARSVHATPEPRPDRRTRPLSSVAQSSSVSFTTAVDRAMTHPRAPTTRCKGTNDAQH